MRIGKKLKRIRKERSFSQVELAKLLQINQSRLKFF